MRRLLFGTAILALSAFVLAACLDGKEDLQELDRRNQETMASLPVFPGAVLIRTYTIKSEDIRILNHEYATDVGTQELKDFYVKTLRELGWQLEVLEDEDVALAGVLAFSKDDAWVQLGFFGPSRTVGASASELTPVASPPPGTEVIFRIMAIQMRSEP